ncbi:MAG: APC family permease [Gammaproteobacteria bacterium]|nr:APC family permease [Gammaproteobacteria bacterium]
MSAPELKRSVTLPFLILYGVGTMVGAGFYALMGKVVGEAGMAAPLAFVLTGLLAAVSACSFAELSSRFPVSAGAAQYVREGFRNIPLSTVTGWLVILTGVVSAATMTVAVVGFLRDAMPLNDVVGILLFAAAMTAIAAWGVGESVAVVTVITVVEVGALVYVFGINARALADLPARLPEFWPSVSTGGWVGIFAAAFLSFYAFIGFEDMVNMAEEVKDVRRTMPTAVIASIALTTFLYVAVIVVAVLAIPAETLVGSATPVAELARASGWMSTTGVWVVSLLTGINGALVQVIMASRVAYGMAKRGQAPCWMGIGNPATRTPVRATILMGAIVAALALFFPLTTLAKTTSAIILLIFAGVNLALWRVKGRDPDPDGDGPRYPRALPLAGFAICIAVLAFQGWLLL